MQSQFDILNTASQVISVREQVKGTFSAHFDNQKPSATGLNQGMPLGSVNREISTDALRPVESVQQIRGGESLNFDDQSQADRPKKTKLEYPLVEGKTKVAEGKNSVYEEYVAKLKETIEHKPIQDLIKKDIFYKEITSDIVSEE